jgi:hypothetical protein
VKEPLFLTRVQIEKLHEVGLSRYGGACGLGDESLFESAIAQPRNICTMLELISLAWLLLMPTI